MNPAIVERLEKRFQITIPGYVRRKFSRVALEEKKIGEVSLAAVPTDEFLAVYRKKLKTDFLTFEFKVSWSFLFSYTADRVSRVCSNWLRGLLIQRFPGCIIGKLSACTHVLIEKVTRWKRWR